MKKPLEIATAGIHWREELRREQGSSIEEQRVPDKLKPPTISLSLFCGFGTFPVRRRPLVSREGKGRGKILFPFMGRRKSEEQNIIRGLETGEDETAGEGRITSLGGLIEVIRRRNGLFEMSNWSFLRKQKSSMRGTEGAEREDWGEESVSGEGSVRLAACRGASSDSVRPSSVLSFFWTTKEFSFFFF